MKERKKERKNDKVLGFLLLYLPFKRLSQIAVAYAALLIFLKASLGIITLVKPKTKFSYLEIYVRLVYFQAIRAKLHQRSNKIP